jgi:hypothetical protein
MLLVRSVLRLAKIASRRVESPARIFLLLAVAGANDDNVALGESAA